MLQQGDTLETLGKIFGVGGIGLGALYIVLKTRPWKNGATPSIGTVTSGQLAVSDWELRLRKLHEEYNEELMGDMRNLFEARLSGIVANAIREALTPLPGEIAEALRKVLREKGL